MAQDLAEVDAPNAGLMPPPSGQYAGENASAHPGDYGSASNSLEGARLLAMAPAPSSPNKQKTLSPFKQLLKRQANGYNTLRHSLRLRQNPPACASAVSSVS